MGNPWFDKSDYHPTAEQIVEIVATKTQNPDSKL